jgi:hypothetical protein
MNLRKLHRQSAPILFIPLLLTALTGVVYRLGRSWFDIPDGFSDFLMMVHEGGFLGAPLVPFYVLLIGLGLLGMVVTGLAILKPQRQTNQNKSKLDFRRFHRFLVPIAFIPLIVSSLTGIGYRLGKAWLGLPNDQVAFLLKIHQGSYLGPVFRAFYVLFVGVGLVGLLVTGVQMTNIFRRSNSSS